MPISSFLNEVTPICPSQIHFEVEGSKIFCFCALYNLTGYGKFLRNDIGFAHSRNRLTAVGGKWYTKFCASVFQIVFICLEKGKFLEVFDIREFFTV